MASTAYYNWVAAGRPYTLAYWMRDLQITIKGYGFVVWDYPNDDHLTTSYPEDHAPFSFTGWPIDSPFGWGHALDIMPKPGTDARALAPLARQIIADKRAGLLPGLKYINWTDEVGNVWQTSWKPTEVTRSNGDKGHIHLSGRSDSRDLRALGYDPIARMSARPTGQDDDMHWFAKSDTAGKLWFGSLAGRRLVDATYRTAIIQQTAIVEGLGSVKVGKDGTPFVRDNVDGMGPRTDLPPAPAPVTMTAEQVDTIGGKISAAVVEAIGDLDVEDREQFAELVASRVAASLGALRFESSAAPTA